MANNDTTDASRFYEIGYLLAPTLPETEAAELESRFHSAITDAAGEIVAAESPEMRELSYEIEIRTEGGKKQYGQGQFGWVQFSLPASELDALEQILVEHDDVLRHLLISVDEADLAPNRQARREAAEEAEE